MEINTHYNPHRIDWTKTLSAPGSTRTEGVVPKAGCGGDMSVKVVEGEAIRRTAVGGKVKLELPNGVFDFDTGMSAIEAIDKIIKDGKDFGEFLDLLPSFCDEIGKLDDEELNRLSEHLAELKKKAPSNSMILTMIELMQIMVELNQRQRENQYLLYQAEGERARGDLKEKASLTRAGAGQNFVMSMIGSGVSLAFAGISVGSSIINLKGMTQTLNEGFGLEQSELSMSSKLTDGAAAQKQARTMEETLAQTKQSEFKLGNSEVQPQERLSLRETIARKLGFGGPAEAPAGEPEPENVVGSGMMPDGEGANLIRDVDSRAFKETRPLLFDKDGNFQILNSEGQPLDFDNLPLKPGVTAEDLSNVKTVRQALEVLDLEPKVELKTKISAALAADYETARGNYTLLADNIDSLRGAIEAGTYEDLGHASKDAAKTALEKMEADAASLKTELSYVKAVEVSGQSKCMSAQGIAGVQKDLQKALNDAKHTTINSSRYKVLENKLQMAGTWSSVGASLERVFSGIGSYLQNLRQAEGTEAEIEQSRHQQIQEMLKQLAERNNEGFKEMVDLMRTALTSGTSMRATMA